MAALPPEGLTENSQGALSILIVGAGIGGLSAAIALRNVGHRVLDKSDLANDTGAAIHLCPNANGILRRWGVMGETFGACVLSRFVERAMDGNILKDVDLTESNARWPHPWHLVRRAALHRELKRIATAEDGPGIPVTVVPRTRVDKVAPELGLVTLESDQELKAHLVIGADGIYSTTRKAITGKADLNHTGKAAFRFVLPRVAAELNPLTVALANQHDTFTVWFGKDRRVVMYSCDDNALLNFVCIYPESESSTPATDGTPRQGWSGDATREIVLNVFRDFDPHLKALIAIADPPSIKVWPLLDMRPLVDWSRDKLVLIGDAAHPCLPYQAQGAAQAIEDAASLAAVLPIGTPPAEVPRRLALFRDFRFGRTVKIQEYSRLMGRDWDVRAYEAYNFDHDEIANSAALFKKWEEDQLREES
ncbi:hypothetical protein C8A05DRAFT_47840 [Staphylotrichum tortipilum]|uniref:FAD-binding domain-containing protein n=1 Tax=Staphylotrichum tortipilum TaxID=2831512 RepID=A0AAN6MB96_9PEZI|nr:hypothetical protein C8A05DRAFT_47840 [Staphylotrichum longicolle]